MSFNFSDIEDEDEFDLEEFDETGLLAQASREREATSAPEAAATKRVPNADQTNAAAFGHDADDSDGGDWDNIDWEDAADEEDDADNEQCEESLPAFPQEGITIHIGRRVGKSNNPDDNDDQREEKKSEEEVQDQPAKKKPRKSTVRVLRNVSPDTQQLVLNIRRSHLLCCMIHSLQCSLVCSGGGGDVNFQDETAELLNTALSLIPQEFHIHQTTNTTTSFIIPTASTVKQFSNWFFQFVNQAGQRRRRAMGRNAAQGAATPSARKRRRSANDDLNYQMDQSQQTPSTASTLLQRLRHLSPCYDEEPQLFLEQEGVDPIDAVECITPQEKVMLFLIMVRSIGWRARYVTAFQPIPLKLTVDHPLFNVSSSPTASSDVKPPAYTWRDTASVLQSMIRLMKEGNVVTSSFKKSGRKKRPKRQKAAAAAASKHGGDAIDLVNSEEEEEEERKATQKDIIPMNDNFLSWIEVLRSKDEKIGGEKEKAVTSLKNSKTKLAARWMPILLEQESIDQPELVENILAWMGIEADHANKSSAQGKPTGKWTSKKGTKLDRGNAHRTPKKSPVSYVLAVEHLPSNTNGAGSVQGVRFTDVTRRYANTWSRTLSLRGATSKDIKELRGQCVDEWFQTSLKRLNNCFKPATEGKDIPTKRESKSNQSIDISADRRAAELLLNQRKIATEMKRIRSDSKKALQLLGAAYQHLAMSPNEMHAIDDEIELSYEQLVDILYQDNGMVLSDAEVPVVIDGKSIRMIIEVLCKAKARNVRAAMMLLKRSVDGVIYNRELREKCQGQTIVRSEDEENDNNELCTVYKAILSVLGRMQSQSMSSCAERRQQNAVYSNLTLHLLRDHIPSVAQIQPGLQLYHAALNSLGRHGAHEAISSLLNDMKDPTPDRMAYQIAISSLAKCGKCLDATQLLQQMRLKGFSPDIVCYNELLVGIARQAGRHQSKNNVDSGIVEQNPVSWHKLALEILQDIESQSDLAASITDHTYNSVIACCGKEKAWEAAASIASKASNYTIINNIDSENDEQTSSYFSNLDVFEKNGRGKDAWWQIGTYSSGTDRSLIIGIQPHRNPKLNGMSLVFYRDDLQGNRVKVGRVLLKNDPIPSTKFYYSSIIGMEVSTNMRGEGLSKVLIAIWLDICLQTAAYPRAAMMNKPLIALVLSKFGFVPGDGGIKCVLVRLENDGKDQNNPQLFGLYSPQRKSLDGVLSHRVLRTQNIKLLTSLPDSSGQKGVDVVIKTTFSHPHKPPADGNEDTDEMHAERTLLEGKINAALNNSIIDTDTTTSYSGKMTYFASSEKLSKAFLFV